jgi:hypothetical protein
MLQRQCGYAGGDSGQDRTGQEVGAPRGAPHYFELMRRPKFLLWLLGATHLRRTPPAIARQPWSTERRPHSSTTFSAAGRSAA